MSAWGKWTQLLGKMFRQGAQEVAQEAYDQLLDQARKETRPSCGKFAGRKEHYQQQTVSGANDHDCSSVKNTKAHRGQSMAAPDPKATAKPHSFLVETYDATAYGLPSFSYSPVENHQPDPGEVVWMWVPYQEDPYWGKDRPVLVVGYYQSQGTVRHDQIIVAPLTSKNHELDSRQEASQGRYWASLGKGAWDNYRQESDIRVNRLLLADIQGVRREGGTVSPEIFTQVIQTIKKYYH